MQGVTIGDEGVVAAGVAVTKDIPPFEVWKRYLAKCIKKISRELRYKVR
ncbi:maltose acetyltransferase [Clostridium autoethanogenum]|uniref:Maltose acetyltransferase n=1 Tax=Clostridium autoethanogenum TaxID=84023 RepID=A0A3M0S261_9CLOT|nr:maltose acetyltransferase [Clostridium autoethanogenum]